MKNPGQGKWNQVAGLVKKSWVKWIEDDERIEGPQAELAAQIQARYLVAIEALRVKPSQTFQRL